MRGVVSLAGVPDLEDAIVKGVCRNLVITLMGGPPSVFPERYQEGSPKQLAPLGIKQAFVSGFED